MTPEIDYTIGDDIKLLQTMIAERRVQATDLWRLGKDELHYECVASTVKLTKMLRKLISISERMDSLGGQAK